MVGPHYLAHTQVQQYFFRRADLRHLRVGQFFRYFTQRREDLYSGSHSGGVEASPDELAACVGDPFPDHRHFDPYAAALPEGGDLQCDGYPMRHSAKAVKRSNLALCVPRSSFLEPLGAGREAFYEQRLLFGLPWFCEIPTTLREIDGKLKPCWTFASSAPCVPQALRSFAMTERRLEDEKTFEQLCKNYEDSVATVRILL